MSVKQDRQGVRTAADLERKYKFNTQFAELRKEIQAVNEKLNKIILALQNSGTNIE